MPTITVKTTKPAKHACGFCATGSHQHCPGGVLNGNQTEVMICGCTQHPIDLRCFDCGARGSADVISAETWTCLDSDACEARLATRRREASVALYGVEEDGTPRTPAPATTRREKAPSKPAKTGSECRCSCGGVTKGGAYLPGHDARHISEVYKSAMATGQSVEDALAIFADKPALQAKLAKRFGA